MMRLTRKLYSDPEDEEDDNDERTWKRRRNIGIIGAGTGLALNRLGASVINGKNKHSKNVLEAMERAKNKVAREGDEILVAAGQGAKKTRGIGAGLGIAGASLGVVSEIKRRKLKKKHDENKA